MLRGLRADRSPKSAIVTGAAGVGKSRLAAATCADAENEGWAVVTIHGSAGFGEVPLGPFRTALRVPNSADLSEMSAAVVHEVRRIATGTRGVVVLADDCQYFDEASLALLHQLVAAHAVVGVLTVRSGSPLPSSVTALYKDTLAERISLENLSRAEVDELLVTGLDGPIQDSSAARLWQLTEGNPLYLRELVLSGLESGDLLVVGGEWQWRGTQGVGSRLQEIVSDRFSRLDPDASSAMELVALAGSMPLDVLTRLTSDEAAETLDAHGLVSIDGPGGHLEVSVAHPLHGEIVRSSIPPLRRRALYRNMVDALETGDAPVPRDRLRTASWQIEAGLPVDVMTLDVETDSSLYGLGYVMARRLNEILPDAGAGAPGADAVVAPQDNAVAVRVAEEAFRQRGTANDAVTLAKALVWTCDFERAEHVLAQAARGSNDTQDRARLTLAVASVRFWGRADVEGAERALRHVIDAGDTIDAPLRADAYEQLAGVALNTARPAMALDYAEQAARAEGVALDRSIGAPPASASLAYLGRCAEALDLVDRAVPVAQAGGRLIAVAMLLFAKAGALSRAGRLEEARELVEWLRELGLSIDVDAAATFGVLLGEILLRHGRPASASRIFRDSSGLMAERDALGYRPWALTGLARARALLGDLRGAHEALNSARAIERTTRHYDISRYLAEIEVHRLAGRTAQALEAAGAGTAWARQAGMVIEEATILDAGIWVEATAEAVARLEVLAPVTDSAFVHELAVRCRALLDAEPATLVASCDRLAAMGATFMAAETAAAAAQLYQRRSGTSRETQSAARTATQLAGRCEGAGSARLAALGSAAPLTKREREVATLAAAGRSSKDIAQQMFLSPRTVENHLQHAYVKLGVTDRTALAEALAGRID